MNELITINTDTQTVSARSIHERLNIQKRFSAWFETNSQGFIEGEDFSRVYLKVQANRHGGEQEIEDYNLSIDMAKHICLMSRTEEGQKCRQYLIDLEKAWNTPEQIMARALKLADQTIKTLEVEIVEKTKLIEELTPKATYYDVILACPDLLTTTEISKDYGMSAATFNNLLHEFGIQYKQSKRWFLYTKYEGYGYTHSKPYAYEKTSGATGVRTHMYWTQKGRLFLYEFLKKREIIPMIERGV